MTLVREYQPTFVLGDGVTKEFSFLFEEVSANFVKVIVKHSDNSTYVPVFSVDLDSHKVVFGESETAPLDTDLVCIYRETPDLQDTPFRTLQGYDAKALENILSKIVAMIQEIKASGFSTQILQGTPWQLDLLQPADDNASVVIDYNARILKKGLYFQIVSGNLQVSADGSSFITMPKSADITEFRCLETVLEDLTVIRKLQYKVNNVWYDAEHNAQATADEALDLAQTVQGDLSSHKLNHNNPHETSLSNLTDTDIQGLIAGQFLQWDGIKWKNVNQSIVVSWGGILGNITDQTDLMTEFAKYVKTDGSSTMTNPLKMRATSSFQCAIAPFWDGVGFYKLNDDDSVTLIASIETPDGFVPWVTNTYNIGSSLKKWKNLYLAGKAYVSIINNGYDIAVPVTNSADTFALMSDVALAANSGTQLYMTGVWYAKMYAASTVPTGAEYDGRNYADFSQVDNDNSPIIVIYEGQSGAWVELTRITPPANYNGYITVTSKIWDIVEQSGQQGGQVLWSYNAKTFTPYPRKVSFEDAALTGTPTAPNLDASSPSNQIVNKASLDSALINHGTGRNVGDVFLTMRTDSGLNGAVECDGSTYNTTDFTGAQSIGELLTDGKVPYVSMAAYATAISNQGWCDKFGWDGAGNTSFKVPTLNAYVWQKLQVGVRGNGKTLGLTNGTQTLGLTSSQSNINANGAFVGLYDSNVGTAASGNRATYNLSIGVSTDSTKSGMVADATNDVSDQRVMVQLAISASDQALETCTQVLSDVSTLKGYDYVVEFQAPTSANNYTWYRKYKSGWVEQGGITNAISVAGNSGTNVDVTLPITMADTNYNILTTRKDGGSGYAQTEENTNAISTSVIRITLWNNVSGTASGGKFWWEVKGMAAN